HQSPIAIMKEWQTKRPELFTKKVVNHTGPDIYRVPDDHMSYKSYLITTSDFYLTNLIQGTPTSSACFSGRMAPGWFEKLESDKFPRS
ncbi:hypothetical protein QC823_11585, partial [Halomonas vilamensis]|nr:hypothetical protein [Halomonas vilamensis]